MKPGTQRGKGLVWHGSQQPLRFSGGCPLARVLGPLGSTMEQLIPLPRLGNPGAMESWALPTWQTWTPGQGGEPGGAAPSIAVTPAALQVGELRPLESFEPEGAQSSGAVGDIHPEGTETGLASLGQQAASSGPSCPRLEDVEVKAFHKVRGLLRAWSERWGASHHVLQPRHDGQPAAPTPLVACLCLWVRFCDYLSSLLWAGISVAPFFGHLS